MQRDQKKTEFSIFVRIPTLVPSDHMYFDSYLRQHEVCFLNFLKFIISKINQAVQGGFLNLQNSGKWVNLIKFEAKKYLCDNFVSRSKILSF